MIRYFCLLFIFIFLGCSKTQSVDPQEGVDSIEINSIPPPFNINGSRPCVVWVNGTKVDLPKKDLISLINKIGKENMANPSEEDIHKGWLWPHHANREAKIDIGRARSLYKK